LVPPWTKRIVVYQRGSRQQGEQRRSGITVQPQIHRIKKKGNILLAGDFNAKLELNHKTEEKQKWSYNEKNDEKYGPCCHSSRARVNKKKAHRKDR
jgi:hypothetical protein